MDLAIVWAGLIAFAVLAYVVLDGFDLGIGILFPLLGDDGERKTAMAAVAPVWDGNETWLVFGGGGLMAAFPLAFAIVLPALYAPLTAMLLALVFRGVAFEFSHRSRGHRGLWGWSFALGSLVATLAQGIALGAYVQGIAVSGRSYAGGWFDWLTPFSLVVAAALVTGYALLGACWLIGKTEGALRERVYGVAPWLGGCVLGFIGIISLWTPLLDAEIARRWFGLPTLFYLSPVPVLTAVAAYGLWRALRRRRDVQPFRWALALFVLCYAGLGISLFPYVVPRSVTVHQAAAPDESLLFLLVGAAVLLPVILAYTAHAYWVFRGKVRAGGGYG
jgi:cytochrome d ubiquinol oxidase subunit II